MMDKFKRFIIPVTAAFMALYIPLLVHASDNSVTILPAEGNVQCSDYAANRIVLSMDSSNPDASGTVFGADDPNDADEMGESANYTIDSLTSLSFSGATAPVDFAILKNARTVSVIMYQSGGVDNDANMTLPGDLEISAFSLCYALGNTEPPPPPPPVAKTIPVCEVLDPFTTASLDDTGVVCPADTADSPRSLVCNIELDQPFYGLIESDSCCICNNGTDGSEVGLVECDPDLVAGETNPDTGLSSCLDTTSKDRPLEVTTHIEFNNDPYYCTTIGGRRTCYAY